MSIQALKLHTHRANLSKSMNEKRDKVGKKNIFDIGPKLREAALLCFTLEVYRKIPAILNSVPLLMLCQPAYLDTELLLQRRGEGAESERERERETRNMNGAGRSLRV